ncbi:MAG: FHA domain-containing protein [Bifidobacteriaceae bacterium]|nr:FHA domain-containing protein [Bifidobacteriaceae bacterium]
MARPGQTAVHTVATGDEDKSVSKTHLEFGLTDSSLWVADRGSTNGSSIRRADGQAQQLVAGEPVVITPGETVIFGNRWFQVAREGAHG